MQSGQKEIVLGKGEKERRERRKEKRKTKKNKGRKKEKREQKERKRKKGGKRVGEAIRNQKKTKKHGGVSSDSVYFKSLDFPWNLPV